MRLSEHRVLAEARLPVAVGLPPQIDGLGVFRANCSEVSNSPEHRAQMLHEIIKGREFGPNVALSVSGQKGLKNKNYIILQVTLCGKNPSSTLRTSIGE